MKANKFGAKRTGGFDSGIEGERFKELLFLKKLGFISDLSDHPKFVITPEGWPPIVYEADAKYVDLTGQICGEPNTLVIEDTKGVILDIFKIKAKLFAGKFPDQVLILVKPRFKQKNKIKYIKGWRIMRVKIKSGRFYSEEIGYMESSQEIQDAGA